MKYQYMADGDRSLVRYDGPSLLRASKIEGFNGTTWSTMGPNHSVYGGDYEPVSESEARELERKFSARVAEREPMTDLDLVQRLADGRMSVTDVVKRIAESPHPSRTRPPVRTLAEIESDPDGMPLGGAVEALYMARYGGQITQRDFDTVYAAIWDAGASGTDVGGTS